MSRGYANVGKVWTRESFRAYCRGLRKLRWSFVTVHHTFFPDLAMRPRGFTAQHIENIAHGYRGKGWRAGPHGFCDENQIFGMTPLTMRGNHALGFNSHSCGFEALGNYDRGQDRPRSGRGLACLTTMAHATAAVLENIDKEPDEESVRFHNESPRNIYNKTCPGSAVTKDFFLALVVAALEAPDAPDLSAEAARERAALIAMVRVPEGRMFLTRWRNWTLRGTESLAPAAEILDALGYEDAWGGITAAHGVVRFHGHPLEGAYYDAAKGVTLCPLREIVELLNNV